MEIRNQSMEEVPPATQDRFLNIIYTVKSV